MKQRESINAIFTDIRNALISRKEVLTVPELEKYMGVSKSTIYKMTHERRVPHYKPTGKLIFFRRAEIDEWMLTNRITEVKPRKNAHFFNGSNTKLIEKLGKQGKSV